MKLAAQPRIELLYKQTNLIIPFQKDQFSLLTQFMNTIGEIDTDKEYEVQIREIRRRRSLNANAYYYKLVTDCAFKKGIGVAEYHNENLANLGIPWLDDDKNRMWFLQKDTDWWRKQKETHFCPTDKTEDRKGITYRWFYLLKPSHLFNTKEMSMLIDGIVQDAKELGVETMTPDEIERLKQQWQV